MSNYYPALNTTKKGENNVKKKKPLILLAVTVIFLLGFLVGYHCQPTKKITLTDEEAAVYKYIREGVVPPGYSEINPDADAQAGKSMS